MLFLILCCIAVAMALNYFVHRIRQSEVKIKKLEKTIEYYMNLNLNQRKNGKEEKNKKGKTGEA